MEHYSVIRRFPRLTTRATLLFSGIREAGRAELRDISQGGLGVAQPTPALRVGECLPVTVAVGLNRVGPLLARVVWSESDRAGLELDWSDPDVQNQVSQAMRYLEPLT